jgi:hypothetical protein
MSKVDRYDLKGSSHWNPTAGYWMSYSAHADIVVRKDAEIERLITLLELVFREYVLDDETCSQSELIEQIRASLDEHYTVSSVIHWCDQFPQVRSLFQFYKKFPKETP